jgi:hypothetical protein
LYDNKRKRDSEEPCCSYCTDVTMRCNKTRALDGSNGWWKGVIEEGSLVYNHQSTSVSRGNDDNPELQEMTVMGRAVGRGRTGAMQTTGEDRGRKS